MRRAILLAVIGFLLVLIVRFRPAGPGRSCFITSIASSLTAASGAGGCRGLSVSARPVGDLTWRLHGLELLRGRLALQIDLSNPGSYLRGELAVGFGGAVHGRDVSLDLPLTSQFGVLASRRRPCPPAGPARPRRMDRQIPLRAARRGGYSRSGRLPGRGLR